MDEADRRDIASLVKYPENTAGALMTTDYAWLPADITAGEALDRLRLQAPNSETIYYIYVLERPAPAAGRALLARPDPGAPLRPGPRPDGARDRHGPGHDRSRAGGPGNGPLRPARHPGR